MKRNIFFVFILFSGICGYAQNSGIQFLFVENYKNLTNECKYCIDLNKVKLRPIPILEDIDIAGFNWKNQQITLTEKGKHKLTDLKIPLSGLPLVITLNGRKIYGLWFWNEVSSFGCNRVITFPTIDFKIQFGLPRKNTYGKDPRFDKKLKEYVISKYNQKNL